MISPLVKARLPKCRRDRPPSNGAARPREEEVGAMLGGHDFE